MLETIMASAVRTKISQPAWIRTYVLGVTSARSALLMVHHVTEGQSAARIAAIMGSAGMTSNLAICTRRFSLWGSGS